MTEHETICQIIEHRPIIGFPKYVEALNMAIQALEKQIPKKPIFKEGDCYAMSKDGTKSYEIIPECPNCHSIALKHSYPCRCGQKLDWSE